MKASDPIERLVLKYGSVTQTNIKYELRKETFELIAKEISKIWFFSLIRVTFFSHIKNACRLHSMSFKNNECKCRLEEVALYAKAIEKMAPCARFCRVCFITLFHDWHHKRKIRKIASSYFN